MSIRSKSMAVRVMGLLFFSVLCLLLSGCGAVVYESVAQSAAPESEESRACSISDSLAEIPVQTIFVYVCGAVLHPGVYELPEGARVYEAVNAAGGFGEDADLKALNQAALLSDGQQLTVFTYEETAPGKGEADEGGKQSMLFSPSAGKININTADLRELMQLPGIGEKRARDITAYREAHGPFSSIEDIMKVSGIKSAVFEQIREQISVG